MILKFGRNPDVPCSCTIESTPTPKECVWEFVEKVGNFIHHSYDTPSINSSALLQMTDVTYYIDNPKVSDVSGEVHSTTLSGADVCYLMNDEGKTIERIR